jgi:RNA recognition motif-containing protein
MKKTNGVSKNFKASDRRLASGARPEAFLLSQRKDNINIVKRDTTPTTKPATTTTASSDHKKPQGKVFKLFVGNLGSDASEDVLRRAFSQYGSLVTVEVPMSKGENKGFGFVGFTDTNDFLKAFKEMNGKYVGHHPCVLKRAK